MPDFLNYSLCYATLHLWAYQTAMGHNVLQIGDVANLRSRKLYVSTEIDLKNKT